VRTTRSLLQRADVVAGSAIARNPKISVGADAEHAAQLGHANAAAVRRLPSLPLEREFDSLLHDYPQRL